MPKKLAAVVLGVALALGLAEAGLRAAAGLGEAEAAPVYRPIASADPEVWSGRTYKVPRVRILVVGDSFTFGWGVGEEDAYPSRLVHAFNSRQRGVEVLSVSRPGWNAHAELQELPALLDETLPDVLVVGHCLNDAEYYPTGRMLEDRPELRPWRPSGLEARLAAASVLYRRLRLASDGLRLTPRLRGYYLGLYEDAKGTRRWRRSLRLMARHARERGIAPVLASFPIFDSDLDSDYAYRGLHDIVVDEGEAAGFHVLDLLAAYEGRPGRSLAVTPFTDPHPSRIAHAVAAETLAEFLVEKGLLAPAPHSPWFGVDEAGQAPEPAAVR